MDNLDKLLGALPKNKLNKRADLKIKFKLYYLIFLSRLRTLFDFSTWRINSLNKGFVLAFCVVVVFSATSIFVYASDDILPGNQLYPLKIAVEKIEQVVALNPKAKIATYEKLSSRRLQEAVSLSQKINKNIKTDNETANLYIKNNILAEIKNHESAVNTINNLRESSSTAAVINSAKNNDQKEIEYLNRIASSSQNQDILQTVRNAKEIINHEDYKSNINKQFNNSDRVAKPTNTPERKNKAIPLIDYASSTIIHAKNIRKNYRNQGR